MRKARAGFTLEGATRGNLGALRSALTIYYGDMDGQYPLALVGLTIGGKYLSAVPPVVAPNYHASNTNEEVYIVSEAVDDSGGWKYDDLAGDGNYGMVFVNCTHTDTKGTVWTSY
ncbi:MAG: hypothetical protein ACHQ49_10515 [Elusimicrobiota bacterium]